MFCDFVEKRVILIVCTSGVLDVTDTSLVWLNNMCIFTDVSVNPFHESSYFAFLLIWGMAC